MERRPRSFTFFEEAGFRLRDHGGAILIAAGLCVLLAGLLHFALRAGPGRAGAAEEALVLRFGTYDSRWAHRPVVIVRTRDGAVRQLLASPQALRHCRKGSRIAVVRRGEGLFIHRRGCVAPAGAPRAEKRDSLHFSGG